MTDLLTRKNVWDFWHKTSTQSTLTSRPAKLKLSDKPKIQTHLQFCDAAIITNNRRGTKFYESPWMILEKPIREIYCQYIADAGSKISYGTFIALKPFYVRGATHNDIEMCCCKTHLHARWSVSALVHCAKEQNIPLEFCSYETFFEYLASDCNKEDSTYLAWDCTPDKKTHCQHIASKWTDLKATLASHADPSKTVPLMHFQKEETISKHGKVLMKLKSSTTNANMCFILDFVSDLLAKSLHHRNHLKHYRNTIHEFRDNVNQISIDVDFSENLSVPVKFEPQSLHWSHPQVSVHSGILKLYGEKYYHPYISDDLKHDQKFVRVCVEEMLSSIDIPHDETQYLVIESDNCTSQYKSAEHFYDLQCIADAIKKKIIRVYGIAGHGKGEVDHVGGYR